jgi:SAM-dependent methyltransferase
MEHHNNRKFSAIIRVYEKRLAEFGASPKGVLWKNVEGQLLRFELLAEVIPVEAAVRPISVSDLGCGYGALFDFLLTLPGVEIASYRGYDVSGAMLEQAAKRITDPRALFARSEEALEVADYSFVSGVYNLIAQAGIPEWRDYAARSLIRLWERTAKGLAFNMLNAAKPVIVGNFYRTPPDFFINLFRNLKAEVTLVDDYPLDEWTLLARRKA